MWLDWLKEQLMTEKSVIRQAPITFIVAALLSGFVLASAAYTVLLSVKNDQIAFYKEKLGLLPTPKARYSIMRNDELKKSAFAFTARLRDRMAVYSKNESAVSAKQILEILNG